jgi:hypothetical protein
MQPTQSLKIGPSAIFVRWGARILSAFILLFWGWFLLAHLFGEAGRPSRPLVTNDYVGLTAIVGSLVGVAIAWKWELAGGLLTLAAIFIGAFVNWRVLISPGILIAVDGLLFLLCWWISRTGGDDKVASRPAAYAEPGERSDSPRRLES